MQHEEISAKIFRQLYQRMSAHFEKYGLCKTDCKFIEEQIEGCDHSRMDFEVFYVRYSKKLAYRE